MVNAMRLISTPNVFVFHTWSISVVKRRACLSDRQDCMRTIVRDEISSTNGIDPAPEGNAMESVVELRRNTQSSYDRMIGYHYRPGIRSYDTSVSPILPKSMPSKVNKIGAGTLCSN